MKIRSFEVSIQMRNAMLKDFGIINLNELFLLTVL